VDALLSAELFGVAPAEVLLVGIRAESFEPSCNLSEPVKASLDQVISEVLREVDRLDVDYRLKKHADELDIWWAAEEVEAPLAT
jgi:Ni,Fe-hydrogenase maturation factor